MELMQTYEEAVRECAAKREQAGQQSERTSVDEVQRILNENKQLPVLLLLMRSEDLN